MTLLLATSAGKAGIPVYEHPVFEYLAWGLAADTGTEPGARAHLIALRAGHLHCHPPTQRILGVNRVNLRHSVFQPLLHHQLMDALQTGQQCSKESDRTGEGHADICVALKRSIAHLLASDRLGVVRSILRPRTGQC